MCCEKKHFNQILPIATRFRIGTNVSPCKILTSKFETLRHVSFGKWFPSVVLVGRRELGGMVVFGVCVKGEGMGNGVGIRIPFFFFLEEVFLLGVGWGESLYWILMTYT
jgi:hypothetical protein